MKSIVYFSKNLNSHELVKLYDILGVKLEGNVAVQLHSGEPGNQNFLGPDWFRDIVAKVNGSAVECNIAYEGGRHTTKAHMETLDKHAWLKSYRVDLLDAEGPDKVLEIPNGKVIGLSKMGRIAETLRCQSAAEPTASFFKAEEGSTTNR